MGLTGKGAILMAAAYPNRTSPVLRGSFILNHLEGVPPANPPPGVPALNDKDIGTIKALTVRELMAKHRASPTCSACHAVMDPLGFALENFDAHRDVERQGPLCQHGHRFGRRVARRHQDQWTRRSPQGAAAPARSIRTDFCGEPVDLFHGSPRTSITTCPRSARSCVTARPKDYKLSAIVQAVVKTEQFKMRRVPPPVLSASK